MQFRLASSGKEVRVCTEGCQAADELRCRLAVELGCLAEQVTLMIGAYTVPPEERLEKLRGLDVRIVFRNFISSKNPEGSTIHADPRPGPRLQKSMYPEPFNYYYKHGEALSERHEADMRYKAKNMVSRTRPAGGDLPKREQEPYDRSGWNAVVRRWGAGSAIEPGRWSRTDAPTKFGDIVAKGTVPGTPLFPLRSQREGGINYVPPEELRRRAQEGYY